MKLSEILKQDKITLSFEVFPPKAESDFQVVKEAAIKVADLKPDFMSVTYGAGGSTSKSTIKLAQSIQDEDNVTTIAHLTCVGANPGSIKAALWEMQKAGIENILALRGDRPKEFDGDPFAEYQYASQLVETIKEYGDFCVGGACYPEGHPDSHNKSEDIENLKKKVEAGCSFLTTQMFFDNNIFYNFLYRARSAGIEIPIIPGIMPITRARQVKNAVELSGCNMPERFINIVDKFGDNPDAMMQAGIIYASEQIIDLLANGIKNIHIYSMNNPDVVKAIQDNLSHIA